MALTKALTHLHTSLQECIYLHLDLPFKFMAHLIILRDMAHKSLHRLALSNNITLSFCLHIATTKPLLSSLSFMTFHQVMCFFHKKKPVGWQVGHLKGTIRKWYYGSSVKIISRLKGNRGEMGAMYLWPLTVWCHSWVVTTLRSHNNTFL